MIKKTRPESDSPAIPGAYPLGSPHSPEHGAASRVNATSGIPADPDFGDLDAGDPTGAAVVLAVLAALMVVAVAGAIAVGVLVEWWLL